MNELIDAIRKITETEAAIVWGKVLSIDEKKETCTVEIDELEYEDVLLSINGSGIVTIPQQDSQVLIAFVEGTINAFVLQAEKVKEWKVRASDGILLQAQGENLLSILNDLISEISKIIVVQGTSPNVAALTAIKQRAQKLLKDA